MRLSIMCKLVLIGGPCIQRLLLKCRQQHEATAVFDRVRSERPLSTPLGKFELQNQDLNLTLSLTNKA